MLLLLFSCPQFGLSPQSCCIFSVFFIDFRCFDHIEFGHNSDGLGMVLQSTAAGEDLNLKKIVFKTFLLCFFNLKGSYKELNTFIIVFKRYFRGKFSTFKLFFRNKDFDI
jgi:hypothetical protein